MVNYSKGALPAVRDAGETLALAAAGLEVAVAAVADENGGLFRALNPASAFHERLADDGEVVCGALRNLLAGFPRGGSRTRRFGLALLHN